MAYKVRIEVGRGKNKTVSQSVPLPNRDRVRGFISRSPLVKSNTQIKVTNTRKKKTITGTQGRFSRLKF